MPLADKITDLRKKQGWSQIDLADRLDVSRQSVSKWEMGQAVPELDKIIKMSELFAVTTDYLLKDTVPAPEPGGAAPPPPEEQPPAPEPEKPRRKKWPWVLAACLVLAVTVTLGLSAAGRRDTPVAEPKLTPAPTTTEETVTEQAVEEAVTEQAVTTDASAPSMEQTAVSDPDAPETGMTEYVYEGDAVTAGGGFDEAALEAIAAEYAPYGVTCQDGRWFLEGEPIRVFTDVLTSNGESLTSGRFQGTIRNFAGDGEIDVRTVRDLDHCDEHGSGTLLYMETCPAGQSHWTELRAEHHSEDHHE